mmetsp:Transcript_36164/g.115824  ORF Transcript_36164/g.115824 Transcript_36164/m.115824 type:complete len:218 (-) Transcript_36164:136-789(-)
MGDDEGGLLRPQGRVAGVVVVVSDDVGAEAGHDLGLGFRVEGARRFVEEDDGGVLEEGPGEGDALLFAAAELEAPFADEGFVAEGHGEDGLVDGRGSSGADDVVVGFREVAVSDVVGDGVVQEGGVLGHDAEEPPEFADGVVPDVGAVEGHAAGRRVVEAEQEPQEGALPAAAAPDDGHGLPRRDVEGHLPQDVGLPAAVAEAHVLKRHRRRRESLF